MWLSFVASQALACGGEPPPMSVREVIGWSADGRYLAYRYERNEREASGLFAGVVDTGTDETTHYLLSLEQDDPDAADAIAQWKALPGQAAWDAFVAAHPLQAASPSPTCGAARIVAEREDLEGYPGGRASKTDLSTGAVHHGGDTAMTTLGVERGGQRWVHEELMPAASFHPFAGETIRWAWSPTCRHVAWTREGFEQTSIEVRPAGPVIHIMAHRSADATVPPVFDALTAADFPPHVGPHALKDREDTVVYAHGEVRDVAEQVAGAIPGGATVAPLNWPSAADIVVATGASVLR